MRGRLKCPECNGEVLGCLGESSDGTSEGYICYRCLTKFEEDSKKHVVIVRDEIVKLAQLRRKELRDELAEADLDNGEQLQALRSNEVLVRDLERIAGLRR